MARLRLPRRERSILRARFGFIGNGAPSKPAPPADRGAPLLVVIGDSFTWGWGVGQGEVFTDRLQRLLPRWRVENAGISGLGTVSFHRLLQAEVGGRLRAGDAVMVTLYYNDFGDNLANPLRARVEDGRPITNGIIMCGKTTTSRSGTIGSVS